MCPIPELNLNLGVSKNNGTVSSDADRSAEIIVRTDSGMKKHTVTIVISDQEIGEIKLKVGENEIQIPTYKLTITDDKTEETTIYQVTRDTLTFVKNKVKKSFLSFLGFKRFDKTSFVYDTIAYEPSLIDHEIFEISKYRKLSESQLTYELERNNQKIILYAGDINTFSKPDNAVSYFIVVDKNNGLSFIGDILFREKFLKLTPKVELHIIKRKKVPKNFEYNDKGSIKQILYV